MKAGSAVNLLTELLNRQVEDGALASISENRLIESVTSGPCLTNEERTRLLLSPLARSDYEEVKRKCLVKIHNQLSRHNIEFTLLPLAASTENEKTVIKGRYFTVTLYHQDEIDVPTIILVQLDTSYRDSIEPMTILKLSDTGGLEWLRGNPDSNGELTGIWNEVEKDPKQRIRDYSLVLEPV